eukprot:UN14975
MHFCQNFVDFLVCNRSIYRNRIFCSRTSMFLSHNPLNIHHSCIFWPFG